MSYYASSSGTIQLKHTGTKDEVLKLIEMYDVFEEFSFYTSNDLKSGKTLPNIDVSGYQKYHEEDLEALYRKISDYVEKADIEFVGEDDSRWKHVFEDGVWKEANAEIIYKDFHTFAEPQKEVEVMEER